MRFLNVLTATSDWLYGAVGWGNIVHVPLHTQARQTNNPSCYHADRGIVLSSSVSGGVGWGEVGWGGMESGRVGSGRLG